MKGNKSAKNNIGPSKEMAEKILKGATKKKPSLFMKEKNAPRQ